MQLPTIVHDPIHNPEAVAALDFHYRPQDIPKLHIQIVEFAATAAHSTPSTGNS
jgi:hypothetical protein